MSQSRSDLARYVAAAVILGAAVAGGLVLISRADHQADRSAAIAERAREAAIAAGRPATPLFATLCRSSVEMAAAETLGELRILGAHSGLSVEALETAPLDSAPSVDVTGAQLHLKARGGERQLADFLRAAARARLPVFLDTVEVRRTGAGALEADFSGRLLCRRHL